MPSWPGAIFGSKPTIPNLPPLDLGQEQQRAVAGNQAILPSAQRLVGAANLFSRDQITQMLESVIPGYSQISQNIGRNIASETAGQIPADVSGAVQDSAAARALGGGFGGSGMHGDLVARDLGLTSLNLTQRGLQSAESWMRTAAALYEPSMINVASMFVTPQQQAAFDVQEREAQFQRQWMQNQIAAMPDPLMRGLHDTIMQLVGDAAGAVGGGSSNYQAYQPRYPSGFGGGGGGGGGFGDFTGPGMDYGGEFDVSNPGYDWGGGGGGLGGGLGAF